MTLLDKGDHLNLSGAHKITDYMTTYLQEHYMLPDHRGDEKFTMGHDGQSSIQRRQDIRGTVEVGHATAMTRTLQECHLWNKLLEFQEKPQDGELVEDLSILGF